MFCAHRTKKGGNIHTCTRDQDKKRKKIEKIGHGDYGIVWIRGTNDDGGLSVNGILFPFRKLTEGEKE